MIVKRVVAVVDDVVQTLPPYPDHEVRVPEGHIWVEGDEPFRTLDSNTFGSVRHAPYSSLARNVTLTYDNRIGAPGPGGRQTQLHRLAPPSVRSIEASGKTNIKDGHST